MTDTGNLERVELVELERQYLAGKVAYLRQKIGKRTEAIRLAMGMLGLLLVLELYMLSGFWANGSVSLPDLAVTLLFAIPLVAMSAIVAIVVIGAFGKEPNVGVGNLATDSAGETVGQL